MVAKGFPAAKEDRPQQANTFQVSACGTLTIVSLAKADHKAKPRVSMGEDRSQLRGEFCWQFCKPSTTDRSVYVELQE